MIYEDKEAYLKLKKEYDDLMNYRRLLCAMYIESLVLDICYFSDLMRKFESKQLMDFYKNQV